MTRNRFLIVLWVVLLAPGTAKAQIAGRVSGTVVDPSYAAVPKARVTLALAGSPVAAVQTLTTNEGRFHLSGVPAGTYQAKVEATGFADYTLGPIKVDAAQEVSLPVIRLALATTSESVTVAGQPPAVQTSNAEVSASVSAEQVNRLPNIGRLAIPTVSLTQAGVRGDFINGQRPWFTNITLDGINIQDNYIRGSQTSLPSQLFIDQVSEVTVSTSNVNPSLGGGSAQVVLVTPSGSNQFHGSVHWANRNSALAANLWTFNQNRLGKAPFNQNYFGARFGGPIARNRLLLHANYEALRFPQTAAIDRTILTEEARQGIFTYEDPQGQARKVDILRAMGAGQDPYMARLLAMVPGAERINHFRVGDSRANLLKNTAGYSSRNRIRDNLDNVSAKLDYILSPRQLVSGSYVVSHKLLAGRRANFPLANLGYEREAPFRSDYNQQLASLAWRWSPTPRFTSEVFGGFYLSPSGSVNETQFDGFIVAGTLYTNPIVTDRTAEQKSRSSHYANRSSYVRGKHSFQFGFQFQQMRVSFLDEAGITPSYNLGIGSGNPGLTGAHLPGIRAVDLIAANRLLATLAGYVSDYSQTFNIASRAAGFVDGAPYRRHYGLNNLAFHWQDSWKISRRITVNPGVRYDYYGVAGERDSLLLLPRLENNDPAGTLVSNPTLDFAGASAGRPAHSKDLNNFAPNIGLAWDLAGDGKTALRGGYSIHFVSDERLRSVQSTADQNFGLRTTALRSGLSGRISSGLPPIARPALQVPRSASENYLLNRQSTLAVVDPNLRTPYVESWSFGMQRQIRDCVLEIRYVGNHGVKLFRNIDYNQVIIRENGFLDDFQRALNNGNLARAATGVFNPNYNAQIAGSQPLTVLPQLAQGGMLNQATVRSLIETGQPGQLAGFYQINGLNGAVNFFPNPNALAALLLTNQAHSTHNALQAELRGRPRRGVQFQFNYTYGKTLEDWGGVFMDNNNRRIERSRQLNDQTHRIKANAIAELPFGSGHRLDFRPLRRILGGWTASAILTEFSGTAFSILSGRNTVNRAGRSGVNTATTTLNKSQLDRLFYWRQTGSGPYFVDPSAIGRDGRAAGPDTAPFPGQVFFHPAPGTVGGLQRRMFSGPWQFGLNVALIKTTRITERQSLELRMDSANILNHPVWFIGDQQIDSPNFGRLNVGSSSRVIQVGLRYSF